MYRNFKTIVIYLTLGTSRLFVIFRYLPTASVILKHWTLMPGDPGSNLHFSYNDRGLF